MAKEKRGIDIALRYLLLLAISFSGLGIFYFLFTPLTVYPTYWLLSLFYEVALISKDIILINNLIVIELIPACISGAAYLLLLILNLSTPKLEILKRIKLILFSFGLFLIINIIRIFILSLFVVSNSPVFDATHEIFWYSSVLFVVGIWFAGVKIFKIKEIPFYSDIKFLLKESGLVK